MNLNELIANIGEKDPAPRFLRIDPNEYDVGAGVDFERLNYKRVCAEIAEAMSVVYNFNEQYCLFNPNAKVVIAGGVWRGVFCKFEKVADVDLFYIGTEDKFQETIESFERFARAAGLYVTFRCPLGKMTTYQTESGLKVQFIHENAYATIETLLDTFDIRACKFALETYGKMVPPNIVAAVGAIGDVKSKTIHLDTISYPIATMSRIAKYKQKGYSITDDQLQHFLLSTFNLMNDFNLRGRQPGQVVDDEEQFWQPFFDTNGRRYID